MDTDEIAVADESFKVAQGRKRRRVTSSSSSSSSSSFSVAESEASKETQKKAFIKTETWKLNEIRV